MRIDEGKNCQHAVAEKFQNLSAAGSQGRGERFEDGIDQPDDDEPRRRVGDRRKAADVRVPQHRADRFDRAAFHRSGVNPFAGVAAEISLQETGGDHVAPMGHHRDGQRGQNGSQQDEIVVTETVRQIGCKRITDAGPVGRIAVGTEADHLR